MICVDSSVAAKWSFVEEHSLEARVLLRVALEQRDPIIAPPLLASEVANVICQRVRQGQLDLGEALVLADQYSLPAIYDAQYVALAEMLGTTLWTADQRLLRALGNRLPFVRWIAGYGT